MRDPIIELIQSLFYFLYNYSDKKQTPIIYLNARFYWAFRLMCLCCFFYFEMINGEKMKKIWQCEKYDSIFALRK